MQIEEGNILLALDPEMWIPLLKVVSVVESDVLLLDLIYGGILRADINVLHKHYKVAAKIAKVLYE